MDQLLVSAEGRFFLLFLAGLGLMCAWDNFIESLKAKMGGDSPSDKEEPSPRDD